MNNLIIQYIKALNPLSKQNIKKEAERSLPTDLEILDNHRRNLMLMIRKENDKGRRSCFKLTGLDDDYEY